MPLKTCLLNRISLCEETIRTSQTEAHSSNQWPRLLKKNVNIGVAEVVRRDLRCLECWDEGSIPRPTRWAKNPALLQLCRSHKCGSDLIPAWDLHGHKAAKKGEKYINITIKNKQKAILD